MSKDRNAWKAKMEQAEVIHPPLAPPAACTRCLRPLPADKRQWETCYPCGHEHSTALLRISAVTYGASETRPWAFLQMAKFESAPAGKLANYVKAIAATLSSLIEEAHGEFSDADSSHIVVPIPSSHGLIDRCLAVIAGEDWPELATVRASLTELDSARGDPEMTNYRVPWDLVLTGVFAGGLTVLVGAVLASRRRLRPW